ncbi:sex-regulated protein janus-A-like [Bombus affinis]|uniref:Sex-regulated protein janus-A n=1 Tax=Bombus terrestris TaxID=30195 RepID=A0A9B0BD48_BOMTE|nr:sex-regulated protein janus-A [Bombus terrestris]XP_050578616.1 sex-regulated protein janus-A-like [Bombus affinis]
MSESLDKVPDVDIDDHGKFKYVLIKVFDERKNVFKHIVRGYLGHERHYEIYREVAFKVDTIRDLRTSCVGGGKIEHDPDKKTIKVYGYSVDFGMADHELSVSLLKKKYPDHTIIHIDES